MPNKPPPLPDTTSGLEPQLGGDQFPALLSGYEPILGGAKRPSADMSRVMALLNTRDEAERLRLLERVIDLGQTPVYTRELIQAVPARARHKSGSWRGAFTPGQRIAAMGALALIGGYEAVLPLIEALDDDHSAVREAAGQALGALCRRLDPADSRTAVVYGALVESLRALRVRGRKVVADILAQAPPDLVLGPLLAKGLAAPEWYARRDAAWALGALGDRRAVRCLADLLGDPTEAVRTSAAWALGQIDAPVVIEPLVAALADPDEVVRAAVVEALGAQAVRLDIEDEQFDPVVEQIARALRDPSLAVRHAALDALAALNAPSARRALKRANGAWNGG
jgi:HEAT repeat protein